MTAAARGPIACLLAASVCVLSVGVALRPGAAAAADFTAQQETIERLGRASMAFIERSDRAANAGAEGRERDALRREFEATQRPLDDIYQTSRDALERMAKRVMDEDGDLEALYESAEFKHAQALASQSLYYLNWLNYYGARLYDGARRKGLLEAALRGFSEFAVGDRRTELLVESLLGRGLCHVELGNMEYAVHDLRSVMDDPHASAERKAKARLALLDAYVRGGNLAEALRLSTQLLGSGSRADDNVIRYLRIRALLDGAKKAPPAEAGRYRQEALALMDQLRRAGGGWDQKVTALLVTSIDNPEQWAARADSPFAKWEVAKLLVQKGDYKQAAPLLEGVVASSDSQLAPYQSQAHYFLAMAQFQAGQYRLAAGNFTAALQGADASYAPDAAYLRFKALETLIAQGAPPETAGPYEAAITDYLERFPTHKSAFEARFRLGELRQAQRRFPEAIDAYAQVRGDPSFELRAAFGTLQCRFELLEALDANVTAEQRAALLAPIGPALAAFDERSAGYAPSGGGPADAVPLTQMRAKAAVMRAVYATLQPQPSDQAVVDALADFETKYPDQADLLPQVTKLRMTAYLRLGRFADAQREVERHGPVLLGAVGPKGVDDLAAGFVREGARRRQADGAEANAAAQRTALRLYELLPGENGDAKASLTKARLYETTGEPQKAAVLYEAVVRDNPQSLAALRGLGRIAEADGQLPAAAGYWQQIVTAARPGDAPWYEGRYEVARLTQAMGKPGESCTQLQELKPTMPGLGDADLRKKFDALYRQVCS